MKPSTKTTKHLKDKALKDGVAITIKLDHLMILLFIAWFLAIGYFRWSTQHIWPNQTVACETQVTNKGNLVSMSTEQGTLVAQVPASFQPGMCRIRW